MLIYIFLNTNSFAKDCGSIRTRLRNDVSISIGNVDNAACSKCQILEANVEELEVELNAIKNGNRLMQPSKPSVWSQVMDKLSPRKKCFNFVFFNRFKIYR